MNIFRSGKGVGDGSGVADGQGVGVWVGTAGGGVEVDVGADPAPRVAVHPARRKRTMVTTRRWRFMAEIIIHPARWAARLVPDFLRLEPNTVSPSPHPTHPVYGRHRMTFKIAQDGRSGVSKTTTILR